MSTQKDLGKLRRDHKGSLREDQTKIPFKIRVRNFIQGNLRVLITTFLLLLTPIGLICYIFSVVRLHNRFSVSIKHFLKECYAYHDKL